MLTPTLQRPLVSKSLGSTASPVLPCRARTNLRCAAKSQKQSAESQTEVQQPKLQGIAAAGLAASILLATAIVPGDALAARSGGRTGGSSFRSSAPRAAPRSGPTVNKTYNNYNVNPSPPLIGGFGGGFGGGYGYGYGGGGISLFPTFVTPVGGGIFQLFFFAIIASTLIGVIQSLFNRRQKNDDWD